MNLEFSWWIMINPWSHDEYDFKILMLTKNDEVWLCFDHIWLFDQVNWFLTAWASDWSNLCWKSWNLVWGFFGVYGIPWSPFGVSEVQLLLRRSKPWLEVYCLGEGFVWWNLEYSWAIVNLVTIRRPLEAYCLENVRENFGVQQLPLFNLLKPEELDWYSRQSWSEGGRRLNNKTQKFALTSVHCWLIVLYEMEMGL